MVRPVELNLPATPIAPALARAGLEPVCAAIPEDAGASVRIIVSELIAAAVQRGGVSALEEITVRAFPNDVGVHVEVTDAGRGLERSSSADGPDAVWGQFVMKRLASDWGIARSGASTTVWFDVAA